MARVRYPLFAACVLLPLLLQGAEPARPAPLYALPLDGSWVEYEWTLSGPDTKDVKGTLRLSAVGSKIIAGTAYRWIEIRKEYRQDGATRRVYRKLLIAEK